MAEMIRPWILKSAVHYNGTFYPTGSELVITDPEIIRQLRDERGILQTPEEAMAPAQMTEERLRLEEENAALRAEVERLMAEHNVPPSVLPGGGAKSAAKSAKAGAEPAGAESGAESGAEE